MELQTWVAIGTIVQSFFSIFVLVPIFLVVWQLQQSNNLTRVANIQKFAELTSPFKLQIIQDRGAAELWVHGSDNFAELDEVDKHRYLQLVTWWLSLHENIYLQWENRLINKTTYQAWENVLKNFIKKRNIGLHWTEDMKMCFEAPFATYMEKLLKESEPAEKVIPTQDIFKYY
jgi:hypothetical protein